MEMEFGVSSLWKQVVGGDYEGQPCIPHNLRVAAGDDAGLAQPPQKAPGDGAGLHVDPGGR